MKPTLLITPGDPDGIGPEIVWKTIRSKKFLSRANLICIGSRQAFEKLKAPIVEITLKQLEKSFRPPPKPVVYLLCAPEKAPSGSLFLPGYQSGWAIEQAASLLKNKKAAALVTGPISKERLRKGGYAYNGHTDFLAELCKTNEEPTMMLANSYLRVSLVTTHLPLRNVATQLTSAKIERAILHTIDILQKGWGIKKPRLAILALNPHAGENGVLGSEEQEIISPTIQKLQRKVSAFLTGPFPADTFFTKIPLKKSQKSEIDAVIAMYHDQGLIPVKLIDFPSTVNVTLGLPIVRTSVDHGTAFDIAGKNVADPSSLQAAIAMALELAPKS